MTTKTLTPADIFQDLQSKLSGIFQYMDWAEAEIEKACKAAPIHARPLLFGAFLTMRPEMDMPEMLYRAHCKELLTRIQDGADIHAPTIAEVATVLYEMALIHPLRRSATGLYLRIVRQVLTPARLKRAGLDVDTREVNIQEEYPGQFAEVEDEIKRTLAKRLPKRSEPYRRIPEGKRLASLEAAGIIFPKGGDMKQLYTIGYAGLSLEDVAQWVEDNDALLIDTRLRPYSPRPDWQKVAIGRRLGSRYQSVTALGNVNYKNGGPIQLQDEEAGIKVIMDALAERPVVLLCACKEVDECHRKVIAELVEQRTEMPTIHLSKLDVIPAPAHPQAPSSDDAEPQTQAPLEGFDVPSQTPPSVQLRLF